MELSPLILVLGGARSGKSRYAEDLAARSGRPVVYVATAGPPRDEEMAARIRDHVSRRPDNWQTLERPLDLTAALADAAPESVVLLDCLTLWLTNVMLAEHDVDEATRTLGDALDRRRATVVAVSNEVGEGIVPATSLGRRFRDAQGVLNQRIAARATHVVKLVAGCPLVVKPSPQPELLPCVTAFP